MAKPLVAVVGRPNVGKSTFFNKIAGRRISIVEDTPGVTRDRIYADCEWLNYKFTLIDTGGIEPKTDDILLKQMRRQAEIAIDTCDVILFFTDGRTGMTADDEDVATMLRKSRKPVILVVNKVDHQGMNDNIYDFYALGLGDPFPISATNMLGLGDLLDEMVKHFPKDEQVEDEEEHTIQIAVVGRPNVGKSSLVNRILGQERSMVSGIAGTTRDAIDTAFARDGQRYNIIDTAGIRRKRAIEEESIERYSIVRALAAVRRCDVALIPIGGTYTMDPAQAAAFVNRLRPRIVIQLGQLLICHPQAAAKAFEVAAARLLLFTILLLRESSPFWTIRRFFRQGWRCLTLFLQGCFRSFTTFRPFQRHPSCGK